MSDLEKNLRWDFSSLNLVLGTGFALIAAFWLPGKISDFKERMALNRKRKRKQTERKTTLKILEAEHPLTEKSIEILELPFEELVLKLQDRQLTAKQVLSAYIAKAVMVTKEFNCVTEFVPQMMEWAEELDSLAGVKGPLHGVPICVKDDHNIAGMDSTIGLSKNLYTPAKDTNVNVQILKDLGAIPFCKTNVPQGLSSAHTHNPIFGGTSNCLNKELSSGGSSGGSGSLIGAGGAPFGTGSDIGGSIRVPAHFNGIASLRPTVGRLSNKGMTGPVKAIAGFEIVSSIMAPKAKTLSQVIKLLTRNSIQNEYDPLTVPLDWREDLFTSKKPLRIGYYSNLPFFPALGDTPATVLQAKEELEARGHILIPFEFSLQEVRDMMNVYGSLLLADGGQGIYQQLRNDKVSPVAERLTIGKTIPWLTTPLIKLYIKLKAGSKSEFFGDLRSQNSEVLWDYLAKQKEIKNDVLNRMKAENLDLILGPVYPFPAARMEDADAMYGALAYLCIWNLVDFPCGVVPFGTETLSNIESYDDEGDFYMKMAKKGILSSKGMPIGVQIISKPFKEENVLRILCELEEARK